MHFVDRRHGVPETRHDLGRHLEAEVHPFGADVEQEIAGRRDRLARSGAELAERVKLGRARIPEQPVPGFGTDAHHAGEPGFEIAKLDRPNEAAEVGAERACGGGSVRAGVYSRDQKDRGAAERRRHGLRNRDVRF